MRSTNALQTAEADFRFGLARARQHSEAIALLHGEPLERSGAASRFAQIVRDFDRQSLAYMGIVSFSTGYGGLLPVFPILIAAPQYILGAMSLGALMQAAQAFQRLTSALSWPVDNVGEIARCRASADRVLSLYADMQRLDAETRAPDGPRIALGQAAGRRLVIEDLCIADPAGRILLEHFSTEIHARRAGAGGGRSGGDEQPVQGDRRAVALGQRARAAAGTTAASCSCPSGPSCRRAVCGRRCAIRRPARRSATTAIHRALGVHGARVALPAPRRGRTTGSRLLPLRAQQRLGFARVLLQSPAFLLHGGSHRCLRPEGRAADPGDAPPRTARTWPC